MKYKSHYKSPLGKMLLAADDDGLTGVWFEGQRYFAAGLSEYAEGKELSVFADTKRWLDIYFSGCKPEFTPVLQLDSTDFRLAVWRLLLSIPYGETVTYGDIAAQLAGEDGVKSVSARAVGGAVGYNPVSVIIPCHRVVGAGGALTGYAGGIDKKLRLLQLEGAEVSARIRMKPNE